MIERVVCPKCGRDFKTDHGLTTHYRKKHDSKEVLPPQTEHEKYLHNQSDLNMLRFSGGDLSQLNPGIRKRLRKQGFVKFSREKQDRGLGFWKFTDEALKLLKDMETEE